MMTTVLMDSDKRSAQIERLEVVEMGQRRRWSKDEKFRIVLESMQTPRAISSTARRYGISRSLLINWRRSFRPEPIVPEGQRTGFVPAMVVAETASAMPTAPARGRMVIMVGRTVGSSLTRGSMRPLWPGCSRFWSADDPDPYRRADLDSHRPYRHEERHAGFGFARARRPGPRSFAGDVFVFRGRAGSLIKAVWHDGIGLSLYAKRLNRGRFVWPTTVDGAVALTAAQMSYLLEAIDWRNPQHTWRPQSAG